MLTFQSLASRCSIRGSSGSSMSSGSSSSTCLTLADAWMRSSSEKVRLCRFCVGTLSVWRVGTKPRAAYSASIRKEVRANRLDVAINGLAELANRLKVLLTSPTTGQDGQRQCNRNVCHGAVDGLGVRGHGGLENKVEEIRWAQAPVCRAPIPGLSRLRLAPDLDPRCVSE